MIETQEKTINKENLITLVESLSEEKCGIILEMLEIIDSGFWYRKNHWFGIDLDIMKRLGYKSFDTAKPQPYMDKLRKLGVPQEIFSHTIWDYTEDRIWGNLSNYLIRYFSYLKEQLFS